MSDGPYDFLADFDRDELACLGMRRASDNWLADLDREALLDCFKPSRLLKNWAARLTLEHESDSCAVERAAGGIHARFGYTDR